MEENVTIQCRICGVNKSVDCFSPKQSRCKSCVNEKYRQNYVKKYKFYKTAYYEKVLIRREEKRIINGVYERKAERKRLASENKKKWMAEKGKEYRREWYRENRHKFKEYQKRYVTKSTNALLAQRLRTLIHVSLKGRGNKSASAIELTGCTILELKEHLESLFKPGMTWENHSRNGWHIDHIKPCASFNLSDPEEQNICFHYSNLQPLWAEENIKKSNKIAA